MLFDITPATLIARMVTLLIAFTIHELAHALSADYLGDDTPRRMGRISLNPMVHLDLVGTIMLLVVGFGWAKPVMVNPYQMRGDPRRNMAIVALAGPVSNIFMAILAAIPFRLGLLDINAALTNEHTIIPSVGYLLDSFLSINIILAVFNMIPIGPLDGLKVLRGVLPREMSGILDPLEQYGMILLLVAIFLLPRFFYMYLYGVSSILRELLLFV